MMNSRYCLLLVCLLFTTPLFAAEVSEDSSVLKELAERVLPYAKISKVVDEKKQSVAGYKLIGDDKVGKVYAEAIKAYARSSGLGVSLYKKDNENEYVLAFAGTAAASPLDVATDIRQFAGLKPTQYEYAAQITQYINQKFPNSKLILTGHSLGGGLAQYAAIKSKEKIETVVFNSAELNVKNLETDGDHIHGEDHKDHITNIRIKGDPVSKLGDTMSKFGDTMRKANVPLILRDQVKTEKPSHVQLGKMHEYKSYDLNPITRHSINNLIKSLEVEAGYRLSQKELFIETLKGIPKAFDDLEHGRLEGTLPQTLYDVSKSLLQTVAAVTPGAFSLSLSDLEKMKKTLDSTGSVASLQPNFNVSTSSLVGPNFSENFSAGLSNWSHSNAYTGSNFGPLISPDGSVFGIIHTGLGDSANTGLLSKQFNLSVPLNLNIGFQYNFVTNEYPDFVGSIYNDSFTAELHTPDGSTINLAGETVNSSSFTSVSGLPTDVLNFSTGGETGWKTISTTVSTPTGTSELHFHVKDVGDNVLDSATLIDNVSVK